MINITKQGNNVIVTSDNPNSFHIGNGELSVPLNTIYYVLDDESDFIQFNSTEKGKILFNGTIGDIQVNGNIVNRENILMELDNVFNSAATGGEGGTAGVLAINGYDGYINLKSINGQSLIGSGNIEIEGGGGGSTAGVEAINIGEEIQDWTQKTGVVTLYTTFYDGSYDVAIDGTSFYGLKPIDNSIALEYAGGTVNGNFRCGIKVNEDNFKTINGESIFGTGDITINGGGSGDTSKFITYVGMMGDTRIAVMTDNDNLINEIYFPTINGQQILGVDGNIEISGGGITEETDPVFTEWKESGSIAIGQGNTSEAGSINIGQNNENATAYSILIGQFVTATTGTSPIIIGSDTQSHNDEEILLGISPLSRTGSTDAERTHVAFSKFHSDPSRSSNCFEIRNDNSVYIWNSNNTEMIKLQDYLSKEWTGTQAEYDALGTYDDNTTYNIIEG